MIGFSSFMSTVLLVSSICYVIGKPGFLSELSQEQIDKCMTESGTTEDEIKTMMKDPNGKPEKLLCAMKCLGEAAGEIGKDGKLDIDFIKSHMPPHAKDDDTVISCMEAIDVISTCQDMEKVRKCLPHPMKN